MGNAFTPSPDQDFAQAAAHHQAGRLAEAERLYRQVCAAAPNNFAALHRLGVVAHQLGRPDAPDILARAVALKPDIPEAHNDLGVVLGARGHLAEAAAAFERAATLRPDYAEAHNNLAGALRRLGRTEEAVAHYERVAALVSNSAGAHNNLANALMELHRLDAAIAEYDRALVLAPEFAPAHYNRGVALRGESRFAEAAASFERALAIKPDFFAAKFAACMARLPIVYADEGEIARQRAAYEADLRALCEDVERAARPGDFADVVGAHQPFYLAYQGRNDRGLQALYGAMICRIMAARYGNAPLPGPPAPGEPVRVGIVSGFFRRHSNWKIPISGWLAQLDRGKFRLFGYHTGRESDEETRTAAGLCARFVQGPLPIEGWRRAILDDAPHVLIYPEVGMDPVAAQLAAQRLAPVQSSSWGHPETSGFPTLDFFLSSELMEPAGAQDHYTERLVRLPNLSIYYEPPGHQPVAVMRADLGLRPGAVAYWCSQAIYKYLPQFDRVFPRIARDVGDCQFTFIRFPGANYVTELFRRRLDAAFAAFGLKAEDHCAILPRLDPDRYAAAASCCDVALDSIGWSGCNSSLECLAHDLPVVTLPGELMRGRHTAAILEMMGVTETIARSIDDYVATAVRIGRDTRWRAELRDRIATNKHRVMRDRACITALEDFLEKQARTMGS
ncbi:MAG: tetratricopeptide repeat protein [Bradyrhizobiaceae bacterium]|nr:tetratricopeptide repeat protein [Hyphomicrobiales bacterium]MBV9429540.1 tetratricopeptide repeat protein [Bradyrhizobiaceae bacterium]